MRLPSFSNLYLADKCPAAFALPWVQAENEFADRGTSRHAFNANRKTLGKKAALEEVKAKHRDEAEGLDTSVIDAFFGGMETVRSEVAYAYDPDTDEARELGQNLGRNYSAADPAEEICGTTDDIGTDGVVIKLFDLKGRAKKDPIQLEAQAIAASRVLGVDEVEAAYGYAQDDGSVIPERYRFSALDLDLVRDKLRDIKRKVKRVHLVVAEGRTPDLNEGEHCTYCPARKKCPAKLALVTAAAKAALDVPTVQVRDLSRAQLTEVVKPLRRYQAVIEAVLDEVKAIVLESGEPLELGDGMVFAVQQGRETIDGKVALSVLKAEFGEDAASKASKPSVTKDLLKKACGADVGRVIDLIREAGGVSSGVPYVKAVKGGGR